jgi:hypothetical protein
MYKMSRSWVDVPIFYVLLFGVAYVAWYDFAMDPKASVHQVLCKSRKKYDGDPANDQTHIRKTAWAVHGKLILKECEKGEMR